MTQSVANTAKRVIIVIVGMAVVSYLVVRRSNRAKVAAATLEKYKREPVRMPAQRTAPKPTQLEVA